MVLILQFGDPVKITKLTYTIIDPFILQTWVSLHTVLKTAHLNIANSVFEKNTKYNVHQQFCLYGIKNLLQLLMNDWPLS